MGQFPDSVVREAWRRAGGSLPPAPSRCECRRVTHAHSIPHGSQLIWGNRGYAGRGCWEAHHRVAQASGGQPILSNCEILCWDCHKETGTYGG